MLLKKNKVKYVYIDKIAYAKNARKGKKIIRRSRDDRFNNAYNKRYV